MSLNPRAPTNPTTPGSYLGSDGRTDAARFDPRTYSGNSSAATSRAGTQAPGSPAASRVAPPSSSGGTTTARTSSEIRQQMSIDTMNNPTDGASKSSGK